jgi:hypothetical protein
VLVVARSLFTLILPAASESKQGESAATQLRQTDATFCRRQAALDCLESFASRFSPSMRSRVHSSDTASVAEGKTRVGTSEELRSLVQTFCSVGRNNHALDTKALLRQPGQLHDSRNQSPSGMQDNVSAARFRDNGWQARNLTSTAGKILRRNPRRLSRLIRIRCPCRGW